MTTAALTEHEDKFLDHVAKCIVAVACAAHPNDPAAAEALALRTVDAMPFYRLAAEPVRPMDTDDIDPETGEEYGAGPDIEPEEETAWEAGQELEEQEAGS